MAKNQNSRAIEVSELAVASGQLAIDTEFIGEGRYQSMLCLVQTAVPTGSGVRIDLFDPLERDFDYSSLANVLSDPTVEIVMHAGRQDVALLKREWQASISSLFDTQIAAGFLGYRAQMGYDALLQKELRVDLDKSASYTKWDNRPLTKEQLQYAEGDVRHLIQLANRLQDRCRDLGRLDWAKEECRALEAFSDIRDPERILNRLPKVERLSAKSLATAYELVCWREQAAKLMNKPPSTVLQDNPLLEIARKRPTQNEKLKQIRGVNGLVTGRFNNQVIRAVQEAENKEPPTLIKTKRRHVDPADPALVVLSESLVRSIAKKSDLAYELLASRDDLNAIITSFRDQSETQDIRTLNGWRLEIVGSQVIDLLSGKLTIGVEDGKSIAIYK